MDQQVLMLENCRINARRYSSRAYLDKITDDTKTAKWKTMWILSRTEHPKRNALSHLTHFKRPEWMNTLSLAHNQVLPAACSATRSGPWLHHALLHSPT